jgi:uncharacterized protein YggE
MKLKRSMVVFGIVFHLLAGSGAGVSRGQVGGNVGFAQGGGGAGGGKARAEQSERARRVLSTQELPPTGTSTFVEANVLMNVRPDEYVVVFALARDGETVAECGKKMEATLKEFTTDLKALGIADQDIFVDFIAQNKLYGFELTGDIAREKLVGFDLKKNVSIHYKDRALLDKLVVLAAKSQIFDLIKVDTVVKDASKIHDRLVETAAGIIKTKMARYEKLLDIKLKAPAQVYAERSGVHYPTDLYDSYIAHDSEEISSPFDRQKYTTQSMRKSRTFYYNGLDGDGFDEVIDPVILEPAVQFTLYLKVKYEVEQIKAK